MFPERMKEMDMKQQSKSQPLPSYGVSIMMFIGRDG
jgi:hypothetical protein